MISAASASTAVEGLNAYSADHPLILLTDYPPDAAGGGAVILRDLLGPSERDKIVWVSPSRASSRRDSEPGPSNEVRLRAGSEGRGGKRSIGLDSTLWAGALAREVQRIADDRQALAFWIVAHGSAVAIAARLTRRHALPVHLTVHDDPAFANALRSKRYLALVPWIERDFASAMRRASSIDVIGEAMALRYRKRYGVEPVVVHRGLEDGSILPSRIYEGRALRVGILGSTYSYEQLPVLGRAVEAASKRLGIPGEIVVMGKSYGERLKAEMAGKIGVDVTGHVDEASAVALLRDCFLLYLNYPFGRRDAVLRQTSFPTKLSTYIQASRPLLLHMPPDSSVMPIVGPDGYAHPWGTSNASDGAAVLVDLWQDPTNHASRHVQAESVRLRYFDRSKNRRTLFQTLDALVP